MLTQITRLYLLAKLTNTYVLYCIHLGLIYTASRFIQSCIESEPNFAKRGFVTPWCQSSVHRNTGNMREVYII